MRHRSVRRQKKELLTKAAAPQPSASAQASRQGDEAASLLDLNRTHGNSYVSRLLARRAAPAVMRQAAPPATATATPTPAAAGATATPAAGAAKTPEEEAKAKEEAKKAADEAEFKLLKGKIADDSAEAYVKHRDEFFGSYEEYQKFAAESDKELEDNKLRKYIELSGDAQTVFFRWVRKAYHKSGITDVPATIKGQGSKEMRDALSKVRKEYGKDFKSGGFNPRPMKNADYQYRLGTISEHGTGKAIDIEDASNPILSKSDWAFIEEVAGKTVDRSASRWEKNPEDLWKDIKAVNDLFVKNLAAKVEAEKKKREDEKAAADKAAESKAAESKADEKKDEKKDKKSDAKKDKPLPEPLDAVLAGHSDLKKWKDGFFTLEWELVNQLHGNGLLWGATFSNAVDLHHFELKD